MKLNEMILNALKEKGMSQKELAKKLFVTPQAVSKWVSGETTPAFDKIQDIETVLGIDLTRSMTKRKRKESQGDELPFMHLVDVESLSLARNYAIDLIHKAEVDLNYDYATNRLVEWFLTASIGLRATHCIFNGYGINAELELAPLLASFLQSHEVIEEYADSLREILSLEDNSEYQDVDLYADYARGILDVYRKFKTSIRTGQNEEYPFSFLVAINEILDIIPQYEIVID